jgi:hypothetical protein
MIIRRKHKSRFTIVPNAIFEDRRLSPEAKGVLGYLLSRPHDWTVRHSQLQDTMRIGRKWLDRIMQELIAAGYMRRDQEQGRDENNRFTTYNYIVSDEPDSDGSADRVPGVPTAHRHRPLRDTDTGNKKEEITKQSSYLLPLPLTAEPVEKPRAIRVEWTELGRAAQANGMYPVWEGSKPFESWRAFRGPDGMPLFDRAIQDGVARRVVWMPSLYPPSRAGGSISTTIRAGPSCPS